MRFAAPALLSAITAAWNPAPHVASPSDACRVDGKMARLAEAPEASGMAISRRIQGRLWVHNDSGAPVVFGVDENGRVVQRVSITGATLRDWEDIAVAPCAGGSCLYIADIGDNEAHRRD